jgi:hypothetical protein
MRAWHDYNLVAYSVDGRARQITFDVVWPASSTADIPKARIVFSGVEAYFFEHDLGVNILNSVTEVSVDDFLSQNALHFEKERKWGWPLFWRKGEADARVYLQRVGAKCIEVATSYGLSGWIIAANVEHHSLEA